MHNNSKKADKKARPSSTQGIRLNKLLSNAGICSRREADQYIAMGLVKINGKVVTEMGFKVQRGDQVHYDDQFVKRNSPVYLLLNKPKGFIASTQGGEINKSVQELIRSKHPEKVSPIGDMGRTVTGLLLLTNDDKMRQKIADSNSRYNILYQVVLEQNAQTADLDALIKGIRIRDKVYKIKSISGVK